MKTILAIAILSIGTSAFAQVYQEATCKVEAPCQFYKKGLDYCVGHTSLRFNDRNQNGLVSQIVVGKDIPGDFREIFRIAARFEIEFNQSGRVISGQTQNGDSWLALGMNPDKKSATGSLVLEQDFEFYLTCKFE